MPVRKQRAASWAACKRAIADWPRPGVIALVKELYDLSDDNRRFLHARLLERLTDFNRAEARRKIAKLITPANVFNNRFRAGDVKRVIDQYAKATGDDAGVAELLLADLSATLEVSNEFGGDERLIDHAYTSMERLHKTLERLAPAHALPVVISLQKLAERWYGQFGYGLGDELDGLAAEWEDRLARATPRSPSGAMSPAEPGRPAARRGTGTTAPPPGAGGTTRRR